MQKTLLLFLFLLSGALIIASTLVLRSGKNMVSESKRRADTTETKIERWGAEQQKLTAELRRLLRQIEKDRSHVSAEPAPATAPAEEFDMEALWQEAALSVRHERPVPADIPLMSPEEIAAVRERRRHMPSKLDDALLIQGDAESVIQNPLWNPTGRDLTEKERDELGRLMSDYRYFSRLSLMERVNLVVKPEIPRMREQGDYLEYKIGETPPRLEGVTIAHSTPADRPGYRRIYCFPPETYPDLYHQEQVEQERALERFVEIYSLINRD
jgi:hypothetical protein